MTGWPADAVPDGAVFGPHHLYVGALVVVVVCLVVWDDKPHVEPVLTLVGVLTAVFGFALTWPYYPVAGAALALVGVLAAGFGVCFSGGPWSEYATSARAIALVGVLVALDDVLEHAWGWSTPLDELWIRVLAPAVRGFSRIVA